MKVVLLTTSILSKESVKYLYRLYESVLRNAEKGLTVEHIMLLQNPDNYSVPDFLTTSNYNIAVIVEPQMMSLSEARNRMLAVSKGNGLIDNEDLVAFPDDDCWYPEKNLAFIYEQFQKRYSLDLFFCKYRNKDHEHAEEAIIQHNIGAKTVVRNASSNTIFIRGKIVNNTVGFDRNLGVGTPNNGGEDLDYALRAFLQANETAFLNRYLIGHRDKNNELRGKYFRGSAIVLNRYRFRTVGLMAESLRKLTIGCVLVAKGEMGFSEFFSAYRPVKIDATF